MSGGVQHGRRDAFDCPYLYALHTGTSLPPKSPAAHDGRQEPERESSMIARGHSGLFSERYLVYCDRGGNSSLLLLKFHVTRQELLAV